LQADLGRPAIDSFDDPRCILLELEQVRLPRRFNESGPFENAQNRHLNVHTLV